MMSLLTEEQVQQAARILADLRHSGTTIAELPAAVRPTEFADAYQIQLALHQLVGEQQGESSDRAPAMLKVGCTTPVTQQMLSVDEPIGGRLIADQLFSSGSSIPMSRFNHQPLIECEFAFRIATPVAADGGELDMEALRAVVDAVAPALELVDNRFDAQLGVEGPSTVADNSMATAVVVGDPVLLGSEIDGTALASTTVELRAEQSPTELIAEGVGSEVLGDPWVSLLWAVNHEKSLGRGVAAGTWVITGSCAGAPAAPLDQILTARFPGLGDVSVVIASESVTSES